MTDKTIAGVGGLFSVYSFVSPFFSRGAVGRTVLSSEAKFFPLFSNALAAKFLQGALTGDPLTPAYAAGTLIDSQLDKGLLSSKRKDAVILRVANYISTAGRIRYTLDVKVKTWQQVSPFGPGRSALWQKVHKVHK